MAGTASVHATGTTTLNTVPEGLLSLDIGATGSGQTVTSYFSFPLIADPVYTGAVASSGVTANTITVADSPAPFANPAVGAQLAALGSAAQPFFVKFLTGVEAGRTLRIMANTASTLTLDTTDNSTQTTDLTTSGFAVAAGDTFEVFPAPTLATLFGDTSGSLLLHGAASLFTADSVGIYNTTIGRVQAFFFNTTAGYWEVSGSTQNANNTIVYPYSVISITRRASEAATSIVPMAAYTTVATSGAAATTQLVPLSRVPEVAAITKTTGSGHVVYGSTSYPVDMMLSQLEFGSTWVMNNSPFLADTIAVWDSTTGRFDTYYQDGGGIWRKLGDTTTNRNSFVISAGTAVTILQRGTVSGANSFLPSTMPYSLN